MRKHENRNRAGDVMSTDYGPLQINDYWKLDSALWQASYNPNKADLKTDPWMSFLAGAKDLGDHWAGVSNADPVRAILYWHGTSLDSSRYAREFVGRCTGLVFLFSCTKEESKP